MSGSEGFLDGLGEEVKDTFEEHVKDSSALLRSRPVPKYELTGETRVIHQRKVYRIRALRNLPRNVLGREVREGDLGGWIEKEDNLSHQGACWLFDNAANIQNSRRLEDSVGQGDAVSKGFSTQKDGSVQSGFSVQADHSVQKGRSYQTGHSRQSDASCQSDNSYQSNYSRQGGKSEQSGHSIQAGYSRQEGNSKQKDGSNQTGSSIQTGSSTQTGKSLQGGHCIHLVGDHSTPEQLSTILFPKPIGYVTLQPDALGYRKPGHVMDSYLSFGPMKISEFLDVVHNKYPEIEKEVRSRVLAGWAI